MLNVLIAAVAVGVQAFARSTSCGAKPYVVTVPDDDTFVIRRADTGDLLLFMRTAIRYFHSKNRKDALSSLGFSPAWARHRSLTFLLATIENPMPPPRQCCNFYRRPLL